MRRAGFTLIEIIIVVGLIGLLAAALMPNLSGGFAQGLDNAADTVAADLRYTGQRAVATGHLHRWSINLDEQSFRIEIGRPLATQGDAELPTHAGLLDLAPPPSGFEYEPVANTTGEWRWIDENSVLIDAVSIGETQYEEGVISIAFSQDGGADPARVHMSDAYGHKNDVRVFAFTGEVRLIVEPELP